MAIDSGNTNSSDAALRRIEDVFLEQMRALGATDLHLLPHVPPRFVVAQKLVPGNAALPAQDEIARLCEAMVPGRLRGALQSCGHVDFGVRYRRERFRINVFRAENSYGAAIRRLQLAEISMADLHLPEILKDVINQRQGLVIVSGPTGCGKSTTLAAILREIAATSDRRIITIEDPIEAIIESDRSLVTQREVGTDVPSFDEGLRGALRQYPQVIMVGEMRDRETAETVLHAAQSGHLIFTTLHTRSVEQSVMRLVDMFPPADHTNVMSLLSLSLTCVLGQRLLPRADAAGLIPAFEFLYNTPAVAVRLRKGEFHMLTTDVQRGARQGMCTLDQSLLALCRAGKIRPQDAVQASLNPQQFLSDLPPNLAPTGDWKPV